jgi:hypothetical protein
MDPLEFQEKLKALSLAKDSLATLSRELNSKLLSIESSLLKTLDSELVFNQAVWFIFHQHLSGNHEYPSHQYSDLSKPSSHEISKPFSYNTEQDYLSLFTHYQANPKLFARVLYYWDSTQSNSQVLFPPGLTRETLSYLLAHTILHDLFGSSQSFGSLDISTSGSNQTRDQLTKVTDFLIEYITILNEAFHSSTTAIESDFLSWVLRPATIFPKLLSIFLQATCQTAFSNAILPVISWFQSNEHLDLSADWMSLMVGFQNIISQKVTTPLAASSSLLSPGDEIPPPALPQHSILSPNFLNIFSTFCFLSNLTLAQPGALTQLSMNFFAKLLDSFNTLVQPEVITILIHLSQCGKSTTKQDIPKVSSNISLDELHDLVQQTKQLPQPTQPTNRPQLQSLFSSQLRDAFLPILSVNELSNSLPSILTPPFSADSNDSKGQETLKLINSVIFEPISQNQNNSLVNLLNTLYLVIIKPLLHTPELFNIVTTTPITAISRRNLLLISNYIKLVMAPIGMLLSQQVDLDAGLFQPIAAFSVLSLEQLLATPQTSLLASSTSTNQLASSSASAPTSPSTIPTTPTNTTQISFMRAIHVPAVALANYITIIRQSIPIATSFCNLFTKLPISNGLLDPRVNQPHISMVATPLNALYAIHSMSQTAVNDGIVNDPKLNQLTQTLPIPPSLIQPALCGNRYLVLNLSTPNIITLRNNFEQLQTDRLETFWATDIPLIISEYFQTTPLDYSLEEKGPIQLQTCLPALKQTILAIVTCLSALPSLHLFPAQNDLISTLCALSLHFGHSQNFPQALIVLESLGSLTYALPQHFLQHNYALLIHVLERYYLAITHLLDITSAVTLSNLSLQLVAAINQHIPALSTRLRARLGAVVNTLLKFQVRKHIATHYATILSFHTFLAKETPQNLNLFNGYQRVYHRYISSTLPSTYEFYFRAMINQNRPNSSLSNPQLPFGPPTPTAQSNTLVFSPEINENGQSARHFASLLKTIPSSSSTNLTALAFNELHKSVLSSFIHLPLNGITAMLHPSCGGRHPVDSSRDIYICTECNNRFQNKQKTLKSFLSKYFCDRVIAIPAIQSNTPKRAIEFSELAGYGGGMLSSGLVGVVPPFNLDPASSPQSPFISPMTSYTSVVDYVLAHTTLKMFSICPSADNRWSNDISFLRCFPTFSSFYSYMAQPQNDAIDQAIVLPFVLQYIYASLQSYQREKQQSLPTTSPSLSSTPPSMEQDPLAALAHQQNETLNSTASTNANSDTISDLNIKLADWIDHIHLQLASILPHPGSASTPTPDMIKPLQILPNVPYVGHSTIVEAVLQLERALTVSSIQSKLYSLESLRTILTSCLANSVISNLPYTLPSSIDGAYYQEYNKLNSQPDQPQPEENPLASRCWDNIPILKSSLDLPTYTHSILQRNLPSQYQPDYQFANLYDFGYICNDKSPHHHCLSVYQHNHHENSSQAQLNHSRFFDKHTKLPHIMPVYPSLQTYSYYLSVTNKYSSSIVANLIDKLQPYSHVHPNLPFYPFVEQTNTQSYFSRTKSVNSADDFIFLLCYVLIVAQPRHLPSTLSYIKIIYFGLTQLVFSHSPESEHKSYLDICFAFRAIQNVSDRLRHNAKSLYEKLVPPELLHYSKQHLTPKVYNPSLPTSRPMNKIETQKAQIIHSLVSEGYNLDDCITAVESVPTQILFDDTYKSIIPNKIRSQKPTY